MLQFTDVWSLLRNCWTHGLPHDRNDYQPHGVWKRTRVLRWIRTFKIAPSSNVSVNLNVSFLQWRTDPSVQLSGLVRPPRSKGSGFFRTSIGQPFSNLNAHFAFGYSPRSQYGHTLLPRRSSSWGSYWSSRTWRQPTRRSHCATNSARSSR